MLLHTQNSAVYSQWKEILNKKQSLESVGVLLAFTPFSSRVECILKFQVKFKYSVWENKSLSLYYWRSSEAFFKTPLLIWSYGLFSSWWELIQRRGGERSTKHSDKFCRQGDNLIHWTGLQSQVDGTLEFPRVWEGILTK